jgi:hypothetical protein
MAEIESTPSTTMATSFSKKKISASNNKVSFKLPSSFQQILFQKNFQKETPSSNPSTSSLQQTTRQLLANGMRP